jgi:hypothetical protein
MNNNRDNLQNPKLFLKTNTIIYSALLIGQALFGIVAFFIAIKPVVNLKPGDDVLFYLVPVITISGGFIGAMLYKKRLTELANTATLKEKTSSYQTALIIRYALSEGATLFAIVVFLQGANLYYLIIAGLNILYFLSLRPTKQKMEDELSLSYEEQMEL